MYKKFGSTMLHILIPANHANVRDATKWWQQKMCGHVTTEVVRYYLGRDPLDGRAE
jgi:hypothetical protein